MMVPAIGMTAEQPIAPITYQPSGETPLPRVAPPSDEDVPPPRLLLMMLLLLLPPFVGGPPRLPPRRRQSAVNQGDGQ
jgi:hypothetical protein